MPSEIPLETLKQLYRAYCLAKFVYDGPYINEQAREQHVEIDAHSYWFSHVHDDEKTPLSVLVDAVWAAGRESVGRLIEADTQTCYESQEWWSDGDTEIYEHLGSEDGVIASARRKVGAGNNTVKVVRSEARSFEAHTYRVNEQVLARWGEWEEADD